MATSPVLPFHYRPRHAPSPPKQAASGDAALPTPPESPPLAAADLKQASLSAPAGGKHVPVAPPAKSSRKEGKEAVACDAALPASTTPPPPAATDLKQASLSAPAGGKHVPVAPPAKSSRKEAEHNCTHYTACKQGQCNECPCAACVLNQVQAGSSRRSDATKVADCSLSVSRKRPPPAAADIKQAPLPAAAGPAAPLAKPIRKEAEHNCTHYTACKQGQCNECPCAACVLNQVHAGSSRRSAPSKFRFGDGSA